MLNWIDNSWLAVTLREIVWAFPTAEILHFMGLALMLGALLIIDLRILGFDRALPGVAINELLPWVWVGFGINLVTGILFFFAAPLFYYPNGPFRVKLVLILIAGANALWFQNKVHGELEGLQAGGDASTPAKVSAGLSLALWASVILFGRLIMYA